MKVLTLAATLAAAAAIAPTIVRADAPKPCSSCATATSSQDKMKKMDKMTKMNRFGGPIHMDATALEVTASLVEAGGGGENFSIAKALTSMGGEALVTAEVDKLTKQYGKDKVGKWIEVFDFAVKDALKIATDAGVKLPKGNLSGAKLASTLVIAGLDKKNTFYTCSMLDVAVSHDIHVAVMNDIDKKFGAEADADYHKITNQAMYDFAHALKANQVKLARFH